MRLPWLSNRRQRAAQILGRLGGKARAEQQREPIRAKAREIREQLGLEPDARLA